MPLWTTYLAFLTHNKEEIFRKLQCTSVKHGAMIYYVMRNRGNNEVAPSEKLLFLGKTGRLTWEEYSDNYLIDIRDNAEAYNFMFNVAEDSKKLEIILVCFEKDATHCHRTLLANEIVRIFKDAEYKGELSAFIEKETTSLHTFTELCCFLQTQQAKKIYLIHEPERLSEVREFAEQLRKKGFKLLIAGTYRLLGEKAVTLAIASSDLSLIVAFDDETVEKAEKLGVHCFRIVEETTI